MAMSGLTGTVKEVSTAGDAKVAFDDISLPNSGELWVGKKDLGRLYVDINRLPWEEDFPPPASSAQW